MTASGLTAPFTAEDQVVTLALHASLSGTHVSCSRYSLRGLGPRKACRRRALENSRESCQSHRCFSPWPPPFVGDGSTDRSF